MSAEQELTTHLEENKRVESEDINDGDQKSEFIPIGMYCWILQITKVDLIQQYFSCKARIMLTWPGTKNDYDEYKSANNDYKPKFDAFDIIIMKNCVPQSVELEECNVHKIGDKIFDGVAVTELRSEYVVLSRYVIEGNFFEPYQLKSFPLDCQDLQLTFWCSINITKKNLKNYILVPPLWKKVSCSHSGMELKGHTLSEYDIVDFIPEYIIFDDGVKRGDETRKVGVANFRMKISRKWQIYFWKIGIFLFASSFSSMIVFTMDNTSEAIGDKFGIILTLLLTLVAFQFVISSLIPKLSYNTYLDWYVLTSFGFTFIMLIIIALNQLFMNVYDDDVDIDYNNYINSIIGIIALGAFFLIQVIFICKGYQERQRQLRKLTMDSVDFYNNGYNVTSGNKGVIVKQPKDMRIQKKINEFLNIDEMYDDIPSENIKRYNM